MVGTNQFPRPSHTDQQQLSWRRPPFGFLKCNYDASFNHNAKQATGGWIIQDSNGVSKYWGSATLGEAASPLQAEGKAY